MMNEAGIVPLSPLEESSFNMANEKIAQLRRTYSQERAKDTERYLEHAADAMSQLARSFYRKAGSAYDQPNFERAGESQNK